MRGSDIQTAGLFSYVSCEARVPANHPLRAIRAIVDEALEILSPDFEAMYSAIGRPSIPPEKLLRALLLQAFYTIRSERQLMEQMDYNLLFRWFVGLSMDAPIWDVTDGSGAGSEGKPSPEAAGRNPERDFHGEKRSNATHASTTDPDARLYKKGRGQAAKLCHMGHVTMENRNGLVVDVTLTHATGTAEREAALDMLGRMDDRHRITLAADKAYDTADFVAALRDIKVTPHVAQNTANRRSAIDGRTTHHPGYGISQRIRKRIEEVFGWAKTSGGMRKTRHRGKDRVGWMFTLTATAYNLVRLPKLLATA
ncbi:transposase [Agrobacterium rhizogenes]|nr:transposase [Rhizobium rhizogenes]NTJ77487.1 transposase [Rhizobium rhizogenes]